MISRLDYEEVPFRETGGGTDAVDELVLVHEFWRKGDGIGGNEEGYAVLNLPGKFKLFHARDRSSERMHVKPERTKRCAVSGTFFHSPAGGGARRKVERIVAALDEG